MTSYKTTPLTTGERIRKSRIEKGYTQKELGDLIGVSQAMITQYESNKRTPKPQTLEKFADALQIPVYELSGIPRRLQAYMDSFQTQNHFQNDNCPLDSASDTVIRFDSSEYTEEELAKIKEFAELLKKKRTSEYQITV